MSNKLPKYVLLTDLKVSNFSGYEKNYNIRECAICKVLICVLASRDNKNTIKRRLCEKCSRETNGRIPYRYWSDERKHAFNVKSVKNAKLRRIRNETTKPI